MKTLKGFLTIAEVAERYGVQYHQVRYAMKVGKLKYIKRGMLVLFEIKKLPKVWPIRNRGVG